MPPVPQPGILDIEPYKAGLSKAGNKRVMKLSSNENPLGSSPLAVKSYKNVAKTLHRYPDSSSSLLRAAIGKTYGLDPERIVCGAGSDEIISFLCQAYAGAGDEVLYSRHGFLMYPIYAKVAGATPVTAPEKNLCADVDALLAAVTAKTKILFLANPNNPTGSYLPSRELQRLRKGLREDILLVLDGAYAEYADAPDYSAGEELVDAGENTVVTRTFSKIYGLSALRVGWGYFPASIAAVINRVRGPFNLSTPAIEAATAALADTDFVEKSRAHNLRWRRYLEQELGGLGLTLYPSQANFLLIGFPDGAAQAKDAFEALMEQGVIVRPVVNYGLPECLRITIGLEEENRAVVKVLKDFLA